MAKQKYPEATVGALIINPLGKILLVKSPKWGDLYHIPGGHIELGETREQALKREIKEETGLDIYDPKFLIFQEFIFGKEFWKKKHFLYFDYYAQTKSNQVKLTREVEEFIWIEPKESLKLTVDPYTRCAIKKYLMCLDHATPGVADRLHIR